MPEFHYLPICHGLLGFQNFVTVNNAARNADACCSWGVTFWCSWGRVREGTTGFTGVPITFWCLSNPLELLGSYCERTNTKYPASCTCAVPGPWTDTTSTVGRLHLQRFKPGPVLTASNSEGCGSHCRVRKTQELMKVFNHSDKEQP